MSLKFYMDEHVHNAITEGLRKRGIDVLTVQEDGQQSVDDSLLLDRATELGRIMFTFDDDFLKEAHLRQREGIPFAGVIYIPQKNISVGHCVDDLEIIAGASIPEEMRNMVRHLPL